MFRQRPPRPDLLASALATVLLCLSFTPSLLPRGWILQGAVSGLCAATGYALGCLPRFVLGRRPAGRWAWPVFAALAVPATVLMAYRGWLWQWEISRAMGAGGPSAAGWLGVLPLAGLLCAALVGAAALRRRAAVPLVAVGLAVAGVLVAGLPPALSTSLDGRVTALAAPAAGTRSGSPASLVSWDSLGRQGRAFVTGSSAVRHGTAPIRVYAGWRTAPDNRSRARLAVAELRRTGAFDRRVVCLVVPTGSGWIDEPTVAALEDELDGDTAVAAVQYAALPSWLALATEPESAESAAADLIDEVRRTLVTRPAGQRPRLLLYGHSLGALAAQAPFDTAGGLLGAVDGALISGSPPNSPLRTRLRDGSARPAVRFAAGAADLDVAADPVTSPRVLYLEHPTDPVVRWSPDLVARRPDWLRRPSGAVRWWPVVTFWQVTGDLLRAQDVPAGYGHRYGAEARAAWHLLLGAEPPAVLAGSG